MTFAQPRLNAGEQGVGLLGPLEPHHLRINPRVVAVKHKGVQAGGVGEGGGVVLGVGVAVEALRPGPRGGRRVGREEDPVVGVEPAVAQVDDAHLAGLPRVLGEARPPVLPLAGIAEQLAEEGDALFVAGVLAGIWRAPGVEALHAHHGAALVGDRAVRAAEVGAVVALFAPGRVLGNCPK